MNTLKTPRRLLLGLLSVGLMAVLLSCGGGGGGSGGGSVPGLGVGTGNTTSTGTGGDASTGTGTGTGSPGDTAGGASGTGGSGSSDSTGGTGGGTSTASGSTDGSGVGSGGTGVTADAAGIGAADGLGSIILNGLRYDTDSATITIEDASELQIGMSARVAGKVDANFTSGIATQVLSAAELRGAASGIDAATGTFLVMGTRVSIDPATVWANASGLADVRAGDIVQVWGLPGAPGTLRATRVQIAPTPTDPLVTGTVQNLDPVGKTFKLGLLTIDFNGAAFTGMNASSLANGIIVRARGTAAPVANAFTATTVQGWYAIPVSDGIAVQLAGVITEFASRGAFKVLGRPVDATNAQITGGSPNAPLGDGVKVEVDGFMSGGVLVVKKLRIRNTPGTGGPALFTLIGPIGAYQSRASFKVKGQPVDASGSLFENGTATDLANSRHVTVVGDRVVNGVLIAQHVTFTLP